MSRAKVLMIQGTGSNVGKSWLCTGLCRLLARRGYKVAPFKAQNMSNNAAPALAPGGQGEIGRAQAAQAEAAGVVPHVDMNPILLKPTGERGSQVVVHGQAVGEIRAIGYRRQKARWWKAVTESYERLAAEYDWIIIEGAGSPAEFNLREGDIVNMAMAHYAQAPVLLCGDIDRGGVFASLMGTLALVSDHDRERFAGFIINRFRGDPALLKPALAPFEEMTGLPVVGVVPYRHDILVEREDSQDLADSSPGLLDVAVVKLPTVSNFTDLELLGREPDVGLRYVDRLEDVGNPDLLILPGAKDSLADLAWMRARGLDRGVQAAAARSIPVLGICGGYQLLGESLADPQGVAGAAGVVPGLGLLPVRTEFGVEKATRAVVGETAEAWLLPAGLPVEGYEIHQGRSSGGQALTQLEGGPDGAVSGLVAGSYVHGLLDSPALRRALLNRLRERRGLAPLDVGEQESPAAFRMRQYDALADALEQHLELGRWLD